MYLLVGGNDAEVREYGCCCVSLGLSCREDLQYICGHEILQPNRHATTMCCGIFQGGGSVVLYVTRFCCGLAAQRALGF